MIANFVTASLKVTFLTFSVFTGTQYRGDKRLHFVNGSPYQQRPASLASGHKEHQVEVFGCAEVLRGESYFAELAKAVFTVLKARSLWNWIFRLFT